MAQRFPLRDWFGFRNFRGRDAMAICAVFHGKELFAAPGVAWDVKKTSRVKECEQIRGSLVGDFSGPNIALIHGRPHRGRVVPHRPGQHGRREIAVDPAAQIGVRLSPLAVYAMALNAGKPVNSCSPRTESAGSIAAWAAVIVAQKIRIRFIAKPSIP